MVTISSRPQSVNPSPLDKMAAISQTNWNFTGVCFLVSNWQQPCIALGNGLVPNKRHAIIWISADPIHWRLYAAIMGDELR